ncbi:hypothetical protein BOTNAR_0119g00130 [Botryotinia narcissicola]|uniref:Uncharacterized protein n=1 Tax=Botryotinia narcissicola TaxID=278944 RepID=A0A4Z1IK61_9HELO|nr:hypothetical protein BOTNAR_0119g00130 [Botryotinia narcissicola]
MSSKRSPVENCLEAGFLEQPGIPERTESAELETTTICKCQLPLSHQQVASEKDTPTIVSARVFGTD